jgi:hypothetical protein
MLKMKNVLSEKAVLASLSISRWSARKFDKKVTRDVIDSHNAKSEVGRWNKKLVSTEAMQEITAVITAARNYHYEHTQPWLDEGARILPSALFYEYTETMRNHRAAYEAAADKFAKAYPAFVDQAARELNGMFNRADYPMAHRIRDHFGFEVVMLPMPDTRDFRIALNDTDVDKIKRDVESHLRGVMQNSLKDMAERVVDNVGHMAERLKAYKPATKKGQVTEGQFRDSLIENVRDLAKLLVAFNIGNDPRMTQIIADIQTKLCVTEPDTLREDDHLRKQVAKDADRILASVSDFLA